MKDNKRVCASINFYNEIDCLKQALDSLKDFPLVICVDGKWKKFNDPLRRSCGFSYDGSRELVQSYSNTLLLDCGNQTEEAMSNLCLRTAAVKDYPYLLQIASDEYVVGDYDLFQNNCDEMIKKRPDDHSYYIKFNTIHITPPEQKRYIAVQRLHYDPMFIRLRDVHWMYYFNNEFIITRAAPESLNGKVINGLTIYHDDSLRNQHREKQMKDYQDLNVPREKILFTKWLLTNDRVKITDINILKSFLPDNMIDWIQTNNGKVIYVVRGDLDEEMKLRIRKKFLCKAWQMPDGFVIQPEFVTTEDAKKIT